MAFKITQSRPRKVQKCIAAFAVADDEDDVPGISSSSSKAAEVLAGSANQWVEKGTAYAEAGDNAAALRCWDQAALINPANGQLHEMRAQVLNDLGRTFEAVQAAQQAVRYKPDWAEAHITLARVQLNLGEPQLALASYQSAAKLQPGHPDLLEELPRAQMLAKMHKQQPAGKRAYVVNLENDPSGRENTGTADAAGTAAVAAAAREATAAACIADDAEGTAAEAGATAAAAAGAHAVDSADAPTQPDDAARADAEGGGTAALQETLSPEAAESDAV